MEGNNGSKPLPNDDCMPILMVGGTPTIQGRLGGVDMLCVVDSGSMVSFVTEDFYKKKLQPTCGHMRKDGQMLTLRAANGLEIPYLGYLELTVEVDGVKVPSCGVLVLKDTPATTKQRRDIPGLLGANVLRRFHSLMPCSSNGLMPNQGLQKILPLVSFVSLECTQS